MNHTIARIIGTLIYMGITIFIAEYVSVTGAIAGIAGIAGFCMWELTKDTKKE